MEATRVYIALFIAALAIVASVVVVSRKDRKRLPFTPLSGAALALILGGIVFGGSSRALGYALIGAGAALAVVGSVRAGRRRGAGRDEAREAGLRDGDEPKP